MGVLEEQPGDPIEGLVEEQVERLEERPQEDLADHQGEQLGG